VTKEQLELSRNTVYELFNILKKRTMLAKFLFTESNIMEFIEPVLINLAVQFMVNCIWQSKEFENKEKEQIDKNVKLFCNTLENGILEELYKKRK
jgi:hypothetical protein